MKRVLRILLIVLVLLVIVLTCVLADGLDPEYERIVENYKNFINKEYESEDPSEFCDQTSLASLKDMGYTLLDLDGDGSQELIIGYTYPDQNSAGDIYTLVDGKATRLLYRQYSDFPIGISKNGDQFYLYSTDYTQLGQDSFVPESYFALYELKDGRLEFVRSYTNLKNRYYSSEDYSNPLQQEISEERFLENDPNQANRGNILYKLTSFEPTEPEISQENTSPFDKILDTILNFFRNLMGLKNA